MIAAAPTPDASIRAASASISWSEGREAMVPVAAIRELTSKIRSRGTIGSSLAMCRL